MDRKPGQALADGLFELVHQREGDSGDSDVQRQHRSNGQSD